MATVSRWRLFNLLTWLRWHRSCGRTSVDSTNDAAATRFNCLTSPSPPLSRSTARRSVMRPRLYDVRRCRAHQQSSASASQLLQPPCVRYRLTRHCNQTHAFSHTYKHRYAIVTAAVVWGVALICLTGSTSYILQQKSFVILFIIKIVHEVQI